MANTQLVSSTRLSSWCVERRQGRLTWILEQGRVASTRHHRHHRCWLGVVWNRLRRQRLAMDGTRFLVHFHGVRSKSRFEKRQRVILRNRFECSAEDDPGELPIPLGLDEWMLLSRNATNWTMQKPDTTEREDQRLRGVSGCLSQMMPCTWWSGWAACFLSVGFLAAGTVLSGLCGGQPPHQHHVSSARVKEIVQDGEDREEDDQAGISPNAISN